MARPNLDFEIKSPTVKSPAKSREQILCGLDWHMVVEIRSPYRTSDKFVNALPAIFGQYEATSDDLETSVPILATAEFQTSLKVAIDGALELLEDYNANGYMDQKSHSSIMGMIGLAEKYLQTAREIQWWWNSYRSHYQGGPLGWGIQQKTSSAGGCENKVAPGKGNLAGEEFLCPTAEDKALHDEDRQVFRNLMKAAIQNCRCAQEAAAAVGTYFRNKEEYNKRSGGLGLKYAPKKKVVPRITRVQLSTGPGQGLGPALGQGLGQATVPDVPEVPEVPEDPGVPSVEEPAKPAKKKKDNTMLMVGAAALGLMMLRK